MKSPLLLLVKKKYLSFMLVIFFVVGLFLRLFNVGWGTPYFFNPDERQNIAYPILNSHSLFMLDQQNFDTGTFPLIILKLLYTSYIFISHNSHDQLTIVILISRIMSTILSLGISLLLYFFSAKFFDKRKAFIAYTLSLTSIGLIQFAHFGTIELWEAFFFLLLFLLCVKLTQKTSIKIALAIGIIFGISLATKILTAVLFPLIALTFIVATFTASKREKAKLFLYFICFILVSGGIFLALTPQIILHFSSFYSSIHFESTVALGTQPVFYTQEFYNTMPFLFQLIHIYPFLLNPLCMLLLPISIVYAFITAVKTKKIAVILLLLFFLELFIFQSYVFVKWTRYLIPTLPFIYLLLGIFLDDFFTWIGTHKRIKYISITCIIGISIVFSVSFAYTTYGQQDTRVAARIFAQQHIPQNSMILTEPYDLGIIPFSDYFSHITFIDFYSLETDTFLKTSLPSQLTQIDYIILPSQRIIKTRLLNPSRFPDGEKFYRTLLNGQLGFVKIYETPCDIFCNLVYLNSPILSFEETATVFDRPVVFIFKKIQQRSTNEYKKILQH